MRAGRFPRPRPQQSPLLGTEGDRALARIGTASLAAAPSLQSLGAATDGATRSLSALGVTLGGAERVLGATAIGATGVAAGFAAMGAAGAAAGYAIARAGDDATQTLARLAAATGSIDAAGRAYQGLFALSQQTGVAVSEAASAFSRFAIAAGEVGATKRNGSRRSSRRKTSERPTASSITPPSGAPTCSRRRATAGPG